MTRLEDLATIVRSKNAGPFRLTFDVFFEDRAAYDRVKGSDSIDEPAIAELYGIPEDDVVGIYALDGIKAIKISIVRPVPAGDVRDNDVYGAQQHTPLLSIEV